MSLFLLALPAFALTLERLGSYDHGVTGVGSGAHFELSMGRLVIANGLEATVDILDLSDPTAPTLFAQIDVSPWGDDATAVMSYDGYIAVAVASADRTVDGSIVFFDANGTYVNDLQVGPYPSFVQYARTGRYLLVVNSGPASTDYSIDPRGTIAVIDLRAGVPATTSANVSFIDFSSLDGATLDDSVRINGPGASISEDLEPVGICSDETTAWVTFGANNALATLNFPAGTVTDIVGLGTKSHAVAGAGLDASDQDSAINIATWPVSSFYQSTLVTDFEVGGTLYLAMTDTGQRRRGTGWQDHQRVTGLTLDRARFPGARSLKAASRLGRLFVSTTDGDTDGDGDFDALYAFGGRSLSIRDTSGNLVWNSGDALEQLTATEIPSGFNQPSTQNGAFDSRSDESGPAPRALHVPNIAGTYYAFVGLSQPGGVAVYNLADPFAPVLETYVNDRDFTGNVAAGTAGDVGTTWIWVIGDAHSPTGEEILVVTNAQSGTTVLYAVHI